MAAKVIILSLDISLLIKDLSITGTDRVVDNVTARSTLKQSAGDAVPVDGVS
jgi:hypothetical protein